MVFQHSTPIPTEQELQREHPKPSLVICPQTVPSDHKTCHLVMMEHMWRTWLGEDHGIWFSNGNTAQEQGPRTGRPFPLHIKGRHAIVGPGEWMMVRDKESGQDVAMLSRVVGFGQTRATFQILVFQPCRPGQTPLPKPHTDGRDLYEWGRCHGRTSLTNARYTMRTADGVEYRADAVGKIVTWGCGGLPQRRIARNGVPCALLQKNHPGRSYFTGNLWDIDIGPGIDPVLIVCFVAIMDEMDGKA
mmetsp:Transcript_22725/g.63200  ORF Transcript_22725/g.63200 Transcript_22725/m.63200 type:complete len:246 (-) Transcript_22725:2352-3089(-)